MEFASDKYAQIAIQGPKALDVAQKLTETDLAAIKYYWFTDGDFAGVPARIARTGYTGEDGFEIYVAPEHAVRLERHHGRRRGIRALNPAVWARATRCGSKARWRFTGMRSALPFRRSKPISPGSSKLDKGDFIGRDALVKQKEKGVTRKLIGFEMRGRGIGRDGYEVLSRRQAARVGSPAVRPSPTLNKNIGLCYLPVERASRARRSKS